MINSNVLEGCCWEIKRINTHCQTLNSMTCVPLQAPGQLLCLLSLYSKYFCDREHCKPSQCLEDAVQTRQTSGFINNFSIKPGPMLIFFLKLLLSVKNKILTAISTVPSLKNTLSFVIWKSCLWL